MNLCRHFIGQIAGMIDRFALDGHRRPFGPYR